MPHLLWGVVKNESRFALAQKSESGTSFTAPSCSPGLRLEVTMGSTGNYITNESHVRARAQLPPRPLYMLTP